MPHVLLPGSERPAKAGATRVRDADPNAPLEVTLSLRGPQLPSPDQLPEQALSREEFEAKYGASQADADTVARVLGGMGLKIEEVSLPTRSIRVSGTVGAMQAAFQPKLGIYHSSDQGEYLGREGELMVPAELQDIVTGVFGLDKRRVADRKAIAAPQHAAPMTPADLAQRYNFPSGTGAGQTIAIAEFGGGWFADDVQTFCTKHGLPVPTIQVVPVNLQPLTLEQIRQLPPQQRLQQFDMSGEVMMDIEIVAGLCPGASISVYFATFDQKGWVDLLNQVITQRPVALSISWGLAEDSPDWSAAGRSAINDRLAAAATLGITVCVSSGDDGSGDAMPDARAHIDFPSSSPFVLSVGGTMLKGTPSVEQAWWVMPGRRNGKGGGSTGGGVSTIFPRPAWQNVMIPSLNAGSIDGRVNPDVAALAGAPLYDLTLVGQDSPNGGTSASAPLWAALIARINAALAPDKRQRFLTPLLYQAGPGGQPRGQTGCRDITIGQNSSHPEPGVGYQAKVGFDAVTGWGVPNGQALLTALQS